MIRRGKILLVKFIYTLIDIFFLGLSIYLACLLRQSETLPFEVNLYSLFFSPRNEFKLIFLLWMLVTVYFNNNQNLYQTKREVVESLEIWQVIRSVITASLFVIVIMFVVRVEKFPRSVLFLSAVFMMIFLSLWRFVKRLFVRYLVAKGYNNFNVLIVGAGKVGHALLQEIKKRPALGLNVVGFLDDFKELNLDSGGVKILGKIADFEAIARREFIHKVYVTTHHDEAGFLKLFEQTKKMGIAVRVVPYGFELMSADFFKYNIGLIPVMEYSDFEVTRKQLGKRLFDVVVSFFAIMIFMPVLLLIALRIKFDSPGPIVYKSRRYGRNGHIFSMYKFRSMVQNADHLMATVKNKNEVSGPIFKIKEDPRITKFGRFLRKYSLDELPQLFNVLRGDMSLVGPRPLPIHQIEKEDLRQLQRLEVRPGITGLWQIRGRSDISFSRLVRWDMYYINNWSFGLDMDILLNTIPAVLKGKGAY